jgi:hypothetical protein
VEREHEEQMRLLKMQSRRAQEPPKTITVVAGKNETKIKIIVQEFVKLISK